MGRVSIWVAALPSVACRQAVVDSSPAGESVHVYNVETYSLSVSENYDTLKALLIATAEGL
jgi:hypothetical protein